MLNDYPVPKRPAPDAASQLLESAASGLGKEESSAAAQLIAAEAYANAERNLQRMVDTLRKAGNSWDDITKTVQTQTKANKGMAEALRGADGDVRKFSEKANMSFQQLLRTPIPELAKDMDLLAMSLGKLAAPGASIAMVAQAFNFLDQTLAKMNANMAGFQVAGGGVAAGGFKRGGKASKNTLLSSALLEESGFDKESINQLMGLTAGSLPGGVAGKEGSGAALAGHTGMWSMLTGAAPETVSQTSTTALRGGVDFAQLDKMFVGLGETAEEGEVPLKELFDGFHVLSRQSLLYGQDLTESKAGLAAWSKEVGSSLMSYKELGQAIKQATSTSAEAYIQFGYVASRFGGDRAEEILGKGTPMEKGEKAYELARSGPGRLLLQEISQIVAKAGGNQLGLPERLGRLKAFEIFGLGSFTTGELGKNRALLDTQLKGAKPLPSGEAMLKTMSENAAKAKELMVATNGYLKALKAITSATWKRLTAEAVDAARKSPYQGAFKGTSREGQY